jgi:aldehyde:ferredoxin oxidoreductase
MPKGYLGKILWIDLSQNTIKEEALDEKLCRDYIGGFGIGAKIIFDHQKAKIDPLGPDNIFGFMTGPFTGTQALGGSRYSVVGKSPLTGTWGDANSGGYFGPALKFAGFDGLFFKGIAAKPVYLFIDNGKAEIRDAAHLWGKDCCETEDIIRKELGNDVECACIGPSGENLSLIAGVINNKGRAAARSGLGAVMGSKKLKAVAAKGKIKVPVFDEAGVAEFRKKYTPELGGPLPLFRAFGTPGIFAQSVQFSEAPIKNWGGIPDVDFPNFNNIAGDAVVARQEKRYACYRCVVGCGGHMKEGRGEYKYSAGVHKPEYETLGLFGSSLLNDNIESIIMANDLCNRYGLDTISAGATIAFAMECYENGIITKEDTDGVEMTWGNHRAIIAMLTKIGKREGFGNILADGVKIASEKIGRNSEKYAMHIQGQEYPAHEPKNGYTFAIAYRMDATPGRHTRDAGMPPPGLAMPEFDRKSFFGRARAQKIAMAYYNVADSLGLCHFVLGTYPDASVMLDFFNVITGWNYSMDDLIKAGERIVNIRHCFNIREGFNPLKYKNPDRMVGKPPFKEGPLSGLTIDEETIDREFCEAMEWDTKTTKPSKNRLHVLGMEDVAKALYS